MRIFAGVTMLLIGSALVALATGAPRAAAGATASSLAVGDQLVYEITIELQQHHLASSPKRRDDATESLAQGSETFTINAIGQDGTAYANVDVAFQGSDEGQPVVIHTTTGAKILPDGSVRMKDQVGLGVSDAMSFANSTANEVAQHQLQVGSAWDSPLTSPYVKMTLARKVTGLSTYQGRTAFVIQSTGEGSLVKTTDGKPATGSVALSGNSYYDGADHLLIGEALRTLTVMELPGNGSPHDNYSTTMELVLSSWTHATQPETQSPTEQPQDPNSPTPQPAALPTAYGTLVVPTVTPRLEP